MLIVFDTAEIKTWKPRLKKAKIQQKEFAACIHLTPVAVCRLLNGRTSPDLSTLVAILQFLKKYRI